jgi:carboxyl-terminal processing protease
MRKEERQIILSIATTTIAVIVLICGGFAGGYFFAVHSAQAGSAVASADEPAGVDFSPVWKAWNVINQQFVPVAVASSSPLSTSTAVENQQKVYGMISGLAASLDDPYTFFLPPSENQDFTSTMSGSFDGVGMEVDVKDGILTVVSPLKGTPAAAAGIKTGDQILKIDGVSTSGLDTTAAVSKIRGQKGTQVTLSILRTGWTSARDFKVTRDVINVPIVTSEARPDGIFYVDLSEFTANSGDLFRSSLRDFVQSGDSKMILDLRGNPGGYLDAAVDIGSWFLPSGDTVVTEDYAGNSGNIVHRSSGYNIFNSNFKMVILVDDGSASAAEILADALHYYHVAQLVGTNTFGKGSVQELVTITPETALKVTVARWLGPDGLQIPREGITPDVQVSISDADAKAGKDSQLAKAVELLGGNTSVANNPQ